MAGSIVSTRHAAVVSADFSAKEDAMADKKEILELSDSNNLMEK